MTMRDPDLNTRTTIHDRRPASNMGWIAGAIVVLLLLGALAFTWNRDGDTTAGNTTNTPSNNANATAPASTSGSAATTGSGSTGPRSNAPQSNAPAR